MSGISTRNGIQNFENPRESILDSHSILSMTHLGPRAFDSIGGEVVSTTAFIIENVLNSEYKGAYIRLVNGSCEAEKRCMAA